MPVRSTPQPQCNRICPSVARRARHAIVSGRPWHSAPAMQSYRAVRSTPRPPCNRICPSVAHPAGVAIVSVRLPRSAGALRLRLRRPRRGQDATLRDGSKLASDSIAWRLRSKAESNMRAPPIQVRLRIRPILSPYLAAPSRCIRPGRPLVTKIMGMVCAPCQGIAKVCSMLAEG